jgi:hypothetical protein
VLAYSELVRCAGVLGLNCDNEGGGLEEATQYELCLSMRKQGGLISAPQILEGVTGLRRSPVESGGLQIGREAC